jgi:hypothetical protein
MEQIEGCVFREMLLRDWPEASDEQLDVCQEDLCDMAETENWPDQASCYMEWRRRIGGAFASYAACLVAGQKWRANG